MIEVVSIVSIVAAIASAFSAVSALREKLKEEQHIAEVNLEAHRLDVGPSEDVIRKLMNDKQDVTKAGDYLVIRTNNGLRIERILPELQHRLSEDPNLLNDRNRLVQMFHDS